MTSQHSETVGHRTGEATLGLVIALSYPVRVKDIFVEKHIRLGRHPPVAADTATPALVPLIVMERPTPTPSEIDVYN